jgi:deoxyribonuclease IV
MLMTACPCRFAGWTAGSSGLRPRPQEIPGDRRERLPVSIGAHVSIAGRIYEAIPRAEALGCECLQIFYGSPRQWRLVSYPADDLAEFRRRRARAGIDPLVAHASYLINLASPNPHVRRLSIASLAHSVMGMDVLRGLAAITHIGSPLGSPWREARARVAEALRAVLARTARPLILLEGSAGGSLGASFEELRQILDETGEDRRLGICLDTAHLFAGGWDLRRPTGIAAMVESFDRIVGLRRLRALHFNDSKTSLGSHRDRHDNIGEGAIGRGGFRAIFGHPALRPLPGFIETPGFAQTGPDRRNIGLLKRLRAEALRRVGAAR